jgi:hypothetical protein
MDKLATTPLGRLMTGERKEGSQDGSEADTEEDAGERLLRDPNSPVHVLNLPGRLENLLYTTEAQAGALLREMDAIRTEREHDRAKLREKTARLNSLSKKHAELEKKNARLTRTLHNRTAPLPTVEQILKSQRLEQYTRTFAKHKISSAQLIQLTDYELTRMNVRRGHRRRLMSAVKRFLVGPRMPTLPTPAPTPAPSIASVRQPSSDDENYVDAQPPGQGADREEESESESGSGSGSGSSSGSEEEEVIDVAE